MNSDIKTGDPKLRAFVDQAVETIEYVLDDGDFGFTEAEKFQKGLLEAVQPILKSWQAGDAPYVQTHVIGIAEVVNGLPYDKFQYTRA